MNDSALVRFFGVVTRLETWAGVLFHLLAFPLGLFYFVFLVTGLSLGVGLVVVWVGIPILLVVAGAWWLFGAFERLQAQHLLGADVPQAPREWETAEGVWGKLKAHFGSASTWKDLVYLLAKLVFGIVSFTLLVTAASATGWFFAIPFFAIFDIPLVNDTWVPPLWFGLVSVPLGILVFFASLHVLNAWGWVCARWAEVMFRLAPAPSGMSATPAPAAPARVAAPSAPAAPLPPPAPAAPAPGAPAPSSASGAAPPAPLAPPPTPAAPADSTADDNTTS